MVIRILASTAFVVGLAGCGTIDRGFRINPGTIASYQAGGGAGRAGGCPLVEGINDTRKGAIDLGCFALPGDDRAAYARAADAGDLGSSTSASATELDARYARNRLAGALVKHADDICVEEKGRIVGRAAVANLGFSLTTTTLSTVSTIVGGELAKSILSGGAAVSSGAQDHLNANLYRNQLTQAITKSIDAERLKLAAQMQIGRGQSSTEFTVDDMVRLANQYHQACSFERGLQLLLDAAVNQERLNDIDRARAEQRSLVALRQRESELGATLARNPDAPGNDKLIEERTRITTAISSLLTAGAQMPPPAAGAEQQD